MDKKVVVEDSLRDYIEYLGKYGYHVDTISKAGESNDVDSFNYDAVVISNLNTSSIQSPSFRSSAPVVEARGKTPEDVYNLLESRY